MKRARCTIFALAIVATVVSCVQPEPRAQAVPFNSVVPGSIGMLVRQQAKGVVVTALRKGGPAAAAGVRRGDIVLRYNGVSVADTGQVYRLVLDSPPGAIAQVEVLRDGAAHRFEVPVEEIDTSPRA